MTTAVLSHLPFASHPWNTHEKGLDHWPTDTQLSELAAEPSKAKNPLPGALPSLREVCQWKNLKQKGGKAVRKCTCPSVCWILIWYWMEVTRLKKHRESLAQSPLR